MLPASFVASAENRVFTSLKQSFKGADFVSTDLGCLLRDTVEAWPGFQNLSSNTQT